MAEKRMTESQLRTIYRKYDLKELLKAINRETYLIANDQENGLLPGLKQISYRMKLGNSSFTHEETTMITAWDLIDAAFYAVRYTNESRGKSIITKNDLIYLLAADDLFKEQSEDHTIRHVSGTDHFYFYLWGFIGEQLRFQNIGKVFDNAIRDMYILLNLAPRAGINYIEKQIEEETGAPWYVLISTLLITWAGFNHVNELEELLPLIKWNEEFTKDIFTTIIERYSTTYSEIKESKLKRQVFYLTPYIRSKTGTISINSFLNLFTYEHCLYWTIRNRFLREGSQQFLNDFGELFEEYFQEVLHTYLNENEFSQILPDQKKPRADWKLEICGYTFLIEQKSSLIKLSVKQQATDVDEFEHYFKKIIEAMSQLLSNEQELNKECIKIILLYEDYIKPELLDEIFSRCVIENDHRYWLVTIDEIERLLYLYKHKQANFLKIIKEKIKRENGQIPQGESKGLDRLLFKYDKAENHHMKQEKFERYEQFVDQYIKKLM